MYSFEFYLNDIEGTINAVILLGSVLMKTQNTVMGLLLILFVTTFALACGGSCLTCHPKLVPYIHDKDHVILNECTTCHNTPSKNGLCGQDCFECHSKEKMYTQTDNVAHQALKACVACHEEKVDFMLPKQSISPKQNTLIQILK